MTHQWVKGHGTRNDFVLLPDEDGTRYSTLDPDLVRWLCDRHTGLGADGLIRVTRTRFVPDAAADLDAEWFMDYYNSDGSVAEMCGNGVRVFAHYLGSVGLAELPLAVGTRGGTRLVTADENGYTVEMGVPSLIDSETPIGVEAAGSNWAAVGVHVPNPHAVVFVDDVRQAGPLVETPSLLPPEAFPAGANVEFVAMSGDAWLTMRVFERGVGETQSCGTGACAAAWAAMRRDGAPPGTRYRVDVPGGTLWVTQRADGELLLTGPATLTGRGSVEEFR